VPGQPISFEWIARVRAYLEARLQKARLERDIAKEKVYRKESSDEQ
jgi:hypothetical protein